MNEIKFGLPLQRGSVILFKIDDICYPGEIVSYTKGLYYVQPLNDRCIKDGEPIKIRPYDFVMNVFKPLNRPPEDYYRIVLGKPFKGLWPEAPLEDLRKVLLQMKKDYEKQVEPSIDFSKFRFRIGDTILFNKTKHEILGYYFSEEFNNYNCYGYIINNVSGGHDGNSFGYDEYGNRLLFNNDKKDKWFLEESKVSPIENNQTNNILKTNNNGNEIKLQRTKAVISRGTVPTGYRVRCKVNKATVSSQPLSYTEITC